MKKVKKTLLVTMIAALTLSVNVYATNSYSDDFDDGNADDWTPSGGSWSVSNSGESSYYYQQTDTSSEFVSYGGQISWTDYSLEAKVKRVDTDGWGSCDFIGRRNGADFYLLQLGSNMASLWRVMGGWERLQQASTANALNTWYTYKLEMVGDVITVYKDGAEIISVTDPSPILSGQIGFRSYKANSRFDDVFVANLGAPWPSGQASGPNPSDEETDVPRDVVLSWTPGEFASPINGHVVYFSEIFKEVSDGVGGITQSASIYAPPQRLDFDTTYYWRVDEVNGPPDFTVHQGDIWSFTTEPFAYPVDGRNITATASDSFSPDTGPENTVNGSGLDANDMHSEQQTDMWMTGMTGPQPSWIQY
ncbi:MAG TPA: family 16 glycoside hydrolase, partial [Sedimentisphaerales bacterium]|nr:family 16 glycoside hydrolase [Sedimentisphaerales bacterium]